MSADGPDAPAPVIDAPTRERWKRELEHCVTRGSVSLAFECHRLEMLIRRGQAPAKGT